MVEMAKKYGASVEAELGSMGKNLSAPKLDFDVVKTAMKVFAGMD